MNGLSYQNDLPQESERWVAKYICCNLQTLKFLMLTLTCTQGHAILKLLLTLPVRSCACERSFSALRFIKTWGRATITEYRLCELVMLHVHRIDTVGQVNAEVVLKRWDLGGNRTIHLAFTDTHLKLFIKILL